ncbi:hypothetical protein [Hymenobacter jeollabukensis]|uniref:Gliding motility-associated protein GldM first immunoglobulin-like domain-containing protein n=1 Tax=Hymenobacter jeollabukensis TaxID=2025313 RepID=A0A5R8WVY4_9BACT|nr:hypothetical protein [Hymenobacter jeollabukensis]TLM96616.1 hypothetical protein FDY95_01070 [Hymenobacter jeollabukensis]
MNPTWSAIIRRGSGLLLAGLSACQAAPSAAELARYQSLEQTLTLLNQQSRHQARSTLANLTEQVKRNGWQPRDVAVLREAEAIRTRTDSLAGYLGQLRQQLPSDPVSSLPESAGLPGASADTLQQRLNAYARYIRRFVPDAAPLALDGADDVRISPALKALRAWRYGEVAFKGATVTAARTTLLRQEAEVRRLERAALQLPSQKVGGPVIVFDKIAPMAVPLADEVGAGETYRASLFLTTSAPTRRLTMQADSRPVPVGPDGRGQVAFVVPAATAPGPAAWEGRIQGGFRGQDTTFTLRVPYTILPK